MKDNVHIMIKQMQSLEVRIERLEERFSDKGEIS